ncbi:hypothetical protein PN465_19735 [Nodularia spumigena CS-584]|jgi:hypothetical protein|uniref:Uncharacterized protein n=2 Tax=Nodularia spumigena TaxID=70799 RepID=A0A2S0Q8L3_NODSP|nr:hypothetical protein [Nodularia spumigena]AVZ30707.1 hypothetical protein BMF81_02598 [Nodularia spumigena UHCC 0039]EAW43041.1 hypothetical protein N9414_11444 [Nodularia spumigena CCY9414]MDB9384426.1 hypothetical protein [Nodularia spumigena CS-584]MEA5523459.1 hypothetical protein [Nodularia spumigena UHCC 0143]MEA5557841.1 hypothetical protein [Nodularia spumigena CH309]
MNKALNETLSILIAQSIKSKANQPFENAYKAVLATEKAKYVQGFLAVAQMPYQPIEHGWIELSEATESDFIVSIIDPSLPHLHKTSQELWYFAAQSFTIKQLKAIIEESKEDYPEDDPLPIYGDAPYEYYGDVMLGGAAYLAAYQAAEAKCKELRQLHAMTHTTEVKTL